MIQNRLKSPVVWTAVAAQIVSLLIMFGAIDIGLGDAINAVVSAVCELLVLFGVLNNPTNQDSF